MTRTAGSRSSSVHAAASSSRMPAFIAFNRSGRLLMIQPTAPRRSTIRWRYSPTCRSLRVQNRRSRLARPAQRAACARLAKIDREGAARLDVALTEEQTLLVGVARDFAQRSAPGDLRLLPAALEATSSAVLSQSGWLEMRAVSGDSGDATASCLDVALVAEQFGRALATTPLVGPLVAVELMRLAGDALPEPAPVVALTPTLAAMASEPAAAIAFDSAG